MTRFACLLFVLLLVVAAIIITDHRGQLPAQVASHFGGGGCGQRMDEPQWTTSRSCS